MDNLPAPPSSRFRRWLKAIGIVATLAALVLVATAIANSFSRLGADFTSPPFLATIAAGSVAYGLLVLLLALAWHGILAAIDEPGPRIGVMLAIYARTQIYKYLPSNILHMVGRYAEARAAGASHAALAIAQVAELALLSAAGALVGAVLALSLMFEQATAYGIGDWAPPVVVAVGVAGVGALAFLVSRLPALAGTLRRLAPRGLAAFVLYVLFMFGSGGIAWALASSLGDVAPLEIIGITAAAWLVGFLVPGAPGGLGVRDAVLIAGLTAAGIPGATAIALGHRIVTTLGDTLAALAGFALIRRR